MGEEIYEESKRTALVILCKGSFDPVHVVCNFKILEDL